MTHGELPSNIGVKEGCPLSPTLLSFYIDELETYLDKINGEFSCLFNIVVAILLDVDDVVLFTSSGHQAYSDF